MAVKLGSTDVSFRLGSATPAAVYLGATQVWSAASVPGAPTGLAEVGGESLTWEAPVSDGGAAITSYRIYLDGVNVTVSNASAGFSSPTQWFGFGSGEWQVSAVNSAGEGEKSTPITAGLN